MAQTKTRELLTIPRRDQWRRTPMVNNTCAVEMASKETVESRVMRATKTMNILTTLPAWRLRSEPKIACLASLIVLTANWHQKDRSYWQRQLGQYIASNSSRHIVTQDLAKYHHTAGNAPGAICVGQRHPVTPAVLTILVGYKFPVERKYVGSLRAVTPRRPFLQAISNRDL